MRVLASAVPGTQTLGLVMPLDVSVLKTTELNKPHVVCITSERDSKLRVIGSGCFAQSRLVSVCLPPSLHMISYGAFMRSACQVVTFQRPSKLQIIDRLAFKHSNLRFIVIPASVERIGESCFEECKSLHFIDFETGSRLKCIEDRAFTHSSVERVSISSPVLETIGRQAFLCLKLVSLTMEQNATFVIKHKLIMTRDQKTLVASVDPSCTVDIPDEIETIGPFCFEMWPNLARIFTTRDSKLAKIGEFAFAKTRLYHVTIPATVREIAASAFAFCVNIVVEIDPANPYFMCRDGILLSKDETRLIRALNSSIIVPATIEVLGNSCFYGFDGCIEYEAGSRVQTIEKYAFRLALIESLVIPKSVVVIEEDAIPNPVSVPILLEPGNDHYRLENGRVIDKYGLCVTRSLWF